MSSSSRRRPAKPATNGRAKHVAEQDFVQVTWVRGGRMFSQEFHTDPDGKQARAVRLARLCDGSRDVSSEKIQAGQTYTIHGEI